MNKLFFGAFAALSLAACDGTMTSSNSLSASTDLTYAEFQQRYPGVSEGTVVAVDSDNSGEISENEIQAARDDGLI